MMSRSSDFPLLARLRRMRQPRGTNHSKVSPFRTNQNSIDFRRSRARIGRRWRTRQGIKDWMVSAIWPSTISPVDKTRWTPRNSQLIPNFYMGSYVAGQTTNLSSSKARRLRATCHRNQNCVDLRSSLERLFGSWMITELAWGSERWIEENNRWIKNHQITKCSAQLKMTIKLMSI